MAFEIYDVYFQIFTLYGFVHVAITVMNFVISVCERMDRRPSIDERLDVLEQEMMNLLSGMYAMEEPPRNTLTTTVAPVRHTPTTKNNEDDTEMSSDTEKED